jgi:hypothetical protein
MKRTQMLRLGICGRNSLQIKRKMAELASLKPHLRLSTLLRAIVAYPEIDRQSIQILRDAVVFTYLVQFTWLVMLPDIN